MLTLLINLAALLLVLGLLVGVSYAIYRPQLDAGTDENRLPEQFRQGSDPSSSVSEASRVNNRIRDGDTGDGH